MKRFFFIFGFFLTSSCLIGQNLFMSTSFTVPSGFGYLHPRITLVNGTPMIVWGNSAGGNNIYYSHLNGSVFNTPQQITYPNENVRFGYQEGETIKSFGNEVMLCYVSEGTNENRFYFRKSLDGGLTFSDTLLVNDRNYGLNFEFSSMALTSTGNPIVSFIRYDSLYLPSHVVYTSSDGGNSFTGEINGTPDTTSVPCECCPSSLSVDNNIIYLLYRNNSSNIRDFYVSISENGGLSFDTLVRLDNAGFYSTICPVSGGTSVISGDSVYSAYTTKYNNRFGVKMTSYHKTTHQIGQERYLEPNFLSGSMQMNFPEISGSGDTLGIVWQDTRDGQWQVYFAYSLTGITGFNNPIRVSDFGGNALHLNPHLVFEKGVFHIVWRGFTDNLVYYRKIAFDQSLLGMEENTASSFKFSPNPSNNEITLFNPTKESVIITDANGKIVFDKEIIGSEKINTTGFANGVYIISVNGKKEKLIIQH